MDGTGWGSEGFEQITAELAERILTITLNRPERLNAWTPTMARELIEAFDRADSDDEVGAVIITGAGRGVCAGADLAAGSDTIDCRKRGGGEEMPRDNGCQFTVRVYASTEPVIASNNGPVVGLCVRRTTPVD